MAVFERKARGLRLFVLSSFWLTGGRSDLVWRRFPHADSERVQFSSALHLTSAHDLM